MENDSIRASGSNTLIDLWIEGKLRGICITQEAIGAFVGFDRAAAMTERDRCEFVRGHLPLVVTAAKAELRDNPAADAVVIEIGQLPRPDGRSGDRRSGQRRNGERRKAERPRGDQPDRRRRERRQGERRTKPPKTE